MGLERITPKDISLICDKGVTTQNLAFLSYWYRKKRLQMHFLTGTESKHSLQNSPLESSCVVVAIIENYSTSKPLKASPEKLQILSCETVVANKRYISMYARTNRSYNERGSRTN